MSRAVPTARRAGGRQAAAVEAPVRRVAVRWNIASEALPERFRPIDTGDAELEIAVNSAGHEASVSACLRAGGRERAIELRPSNGESAWRRDPETRLEHIDVPGVVSITLRRLPDGTARLVYTSTSVLSRLGVGGGRYEAAGVVVTPD